MLEYKFIDWQWWLYRNGTDCTESSNKHKHTDWNQRAKHPNQNSSGNFEPVSWYFENW